MLAFVGFGFAGRNNLKTERLKLHFPNLPPSFDGFSVIQISDLHASFWIGRDYLARVVSEINEIKSDLLVITGDIITGSVNDFWKRWMPTIDGDYLSMVIDVLSKINIDNKIVVLGNHDHWDGKDTEMRLVSELERIGFHVLRNRSHKISRGDESVYVAGTDDYWFSYDFDSALRDIPEDSFKLLLSHSPDVTEDVQKGAKVDLTLCGHTHGGQIAVPFLSPYFIPIKNPFRYFKGLVKEPYGYTYVNRGIGTLIFPFRIGAPPEITHFTLRKA
ncbi:MAG: metallophosphoesterase [Nitrospinota bacterium]